MPPNSFSNCWCWSPVIFDHARLFTLFLSAGFVWLPLRVFCDGRIVPRHLCHIRPTSSEGLRLPFVQGFHEVSLAGLSAVLWVGAIGPGVSPWPYSAENRRRSCMAEGGFFGRLWAGLKRPARRSTNGWSGFTRPRIDAETLEELEEALILADLGVQATAKILQEVIAACKDSALRRVMACVPGWLRRSGIFCWPQPAPASTCRSGGPGC